MIRYLLDTNIVSEPARPAAIAATRSLILVTRNTSDFEAYQALTGDVHIENWFSS